MRKIFSKIFVFIILCAITFVSFGFPSTSKPERASTAAAVTSEIMEEHSESLPGVNLLSETLSRYRIPSSESISINGWIYDDQYAGVWYDDGGKLNIGVTNDERANSRSSEVVYSLRSFSYNFLSEIHDAISELMPMYSVVSVAMTPQYNQVEVQLSDEAYIGSVIRYLSGLSLFKEGAINFIIGEHNAELRARSIHGGQGIYNFNEGTISVKATCNQTGRRGVVTNQHVIRHNEPAMHSQTWRRIGTSVRAIRGGTVDASFIPFDNPDEWEFTSSASHGATVIPQTYQVVSRNEIVVGLDVEKFGLTSGRTTGRINAVRFGSVNGLSDQIRHTARVEDGDSGSPLFVVQQGRHVLLGINFASDTNFANSYANKITNVRSVLDVTIVSENFVMPTFSSNSNSHGTITASHTPANAFRAFDGIDGSNNQWRIPKTNEWVQLTLNYDIIIHSIEYFNIHTGTINGFTKDARFTGAGGVALGAEFSAGKSSGARTVIPVGGVRTNIIRLTTISSHEFLPSWMANHYTGASEIIIHATQVPYTASRIADGGVYAIQSVNSGLFLDVHGAYTNPGTRLEQWDFHGNPNQLFMAEQILGNSFRFRAMNSHNMYLDISDGTLRIQPLNTNSLNQRFGISYINGRGIIHTNYGHNHVLDVWNASHALGTQVQSHGFHGGKNQGWLFYEQIQDNKTYAIQNVNSGHFLDVYGAYTTPGTQLQQFGFHGNANQLFRAERVLGEDSFRFRSMNGQNMYLDVSDGILRIQPLNTNSQYQKFRISYINGHAIIHTNRGNNQVLDVYGASLLPNAQVTSFGFHGNLNQRWQFHGVV